MTKAQLEQKISELEKRLAEQEETIDFLRSYEESYGEMECKLADVYRELEERGGNAINDLDFFTHRMELDGIWNTEIDNFITEYMRWYN